MITPDRRSELKQIRASLVAWAQQEESIVGVAIVGSWARNQATMGSDIDVVVLITDTDCYIDSEGWLAQALPEACDLVRTQVWGPVTERRARLESGLEVEFGFTTPTWANTNPIEPGTARVIRDGCEVIFDPEQLLERLVDHVQVDAANRARTGLD